MSVYEVLLTAGGVGNFDYNNSYCALNTAILPSSNPHRHPSRNFSSVLVLRLGAKFYISIAGGGGEEEGGTPFAAQEDSKGLFIQEIWCIFCMKARHWEGFKRNSGNGRNVSGSDKGVGHWRTILYKFKLEEQDKGLVGLGPRNLFWGSRLHSIKKKKQQKKLS